MGDYTSVTLQLHGVPETHREALANALSGYFYNEGGFGWDANGNTLVQDECSVGVSGDLTQILDGFRTEGDEDLELPPVEFSYAIWEDPKYEYLGSLYIDCPGLPHFDGYCDGEGRVVAHYETVKGALDASPYDVVEAGHKIADLFGEPQIQAHGDYKLKAQDLLGVLTEDG